jgi:hypothetical protein
MDCAVEVAIEVHPAVHPVLNVCKTTRVSRRMEFFFSKRSLQALNVLYKEIKNGNVTT